MRTAGLRGSWAAAAIAVLALSAPAIARAAVYVDDPLTSPSFPGRGSKGGSFGAEGWTTTNAPTDSSQDSVWYEIPDALPTGSVEYTVSGLSVGGTLAGNDHDIFTLYQAPTGSAEPIAYSPGFRNNDFKAFTRIFGTLETGREGAMKLEVAFCPRGEPWHHDTACPAGCDQSAIAYANGNQKDVGWDTAVAYRMRVSWGNGQLSFARDGVTLGSVSYNGEYAPQPLRVRFGSPRNDGVYPGTAYMPAGLKFRDVYITGTPGTQTPVCGAMMPDAGAGGSGGTGGAAPDAGTEEGVYPAIQDVTAASWESGVFPDVNDLNIEGAGDGSPAAIVYLRFPAFAGVAKKAILRLRTQAFSSAAGGSGIVCAVADDTWQEATLTWATRPPVGTACAGAAVSVDPDTEIEWDVTPLISGNGNHNLALVSADPDGAHYVSKELGGSAKGPRLYVVADTSSPDAGAGSSGGTSGSGGSAHGTGGSGANGGTGAGSHGSGAGNGITETGGGNGSGCGCRIEGSAAGAGAVWAATLAFAMLLLRRRRDAR